jgi:hypothetical protein
VTDVHQKDNPWLAFFDYLERYSVMSDFIHGRVTIEQSRYLGQRFGVPANLVYRIFCAYVKEMSK